MVVAGRAREARLEYLVAQLRHVRFAARSRKPTPDQLALALEDVAVAEADAEALCEQADAAAARSIASKKPRPPAAERGSLPAHLPHVEVVIPPAETECPCCGGELHRIGEDSAMRLDVIPCPTA